MLALLVAVFSAMLGLGIVAPLMPLYAESLGATGLWLGIIFSGFSLSRAIFMPIIGKVSDKYGKKQFLALGLLMYSIISVAYILVRNVQELAVVRIVHGFSSAMVIPTAMAYVSEIAPKGEEGRYMSTFNLSFLLGIGFGPILGGIIKDEFGMMFAFEIMSILTAFAFLLVLLFVPSVKPKHGVKFQKVILNRLLKALLIFRVSNAFRLAMVMSFLPILISHFSGFQIGMIVAIIILSNALFQRIFGTLADKFDRVKLVVFGAILSTIAFIVLPFLSISFLATLCLGLIIGIGGAISMPSASAMATELGRKFGHGAVMGLFNMAMGVGMTSSPILAGIIMDIMGLTWAFVLTGLVSAIGTALFYHLSRTYE